MDIQFNTCQDCNGVLTITDTTVYSNAPGHIKDFSYKDTITIDIVTLEEVDNPQLVAVVFTTHTTELSEASISLEKDGLYNITHLIVPTLDWYKEQKAQKFNNFYKFNRIIISDGKNLYEVLDNKFVEIDPLDFITKVDLDKTTITKKQEVTFTTCFLYNCYINLAQEALRDLISKNNGNKIQKCGMEDQSIIYKRDFVWATINVINYLIEECKLEEAQKLLERVVKCNGFCFSANKTKITVNNKVSCNCHK